MAHVYAFLILLVLLIIFIVITNVLSDEKDQTIHSRNVITDKLALLTLLRQEIPQDKINQVVYLEENDTYLDFINNNDLDDKGFKIIFSNAFENYNPRSAKNTSKDLKFDYKLSLVKDTKITYVENNVIATYETKNYKPGFNICETFIQIEDSKYLCLHIYTENNEPETEQQGKVVL